jgi:hypothetical protein
MRMSWRKTTRLAKKKVTIIPPPPRKAAPPRRRIPDFCTFWPDRGVPPDLGAPTTPPSDSRPSAEVFRLILRRVDVLSGRRIVLTQMADLRNRAPFHTIFVPSTVSGIVPSSFDDAQKRQLEFIVFEANSALREIVPGLFMDGSLQTICVPSSVQVLGHRAFRNCRSLATVLFEMHSQLRSIESLCFDFSDSLAAIFLPPGLSELDPDMLKPQNATYFWVDPDNAHFSVEGDFLMDKAKRYPLKYVGSSPTVRFNGAHRAVGPSCFRRNTQVAKVVFESPCCVVAFFKYSFSRTGVRSITVPKSVKLLDGWAFNGCQFLVTVYFEENSSLEMIGYACFATSSLARLVVPRTVQSIGDSCFSSCEQLVDLRLEPASMLSHYGDDIFKYCAKLHVVVLPVRLKTVPSPEYYKSPVRFQYSEFL